MRIYEGSERKFQLKVNTHSIILEKNNQTVLIKQGTHVWPKGASDPIETPYWWWRRVRAIETADTEQFMKAYSVESEKVCFDKCPTWEDRSFEPCISQTSVGQSGRARRQLLCNMMALCLVGSVRQSAPSQKTISSRQTCSAGSASSNPGQNAPSGHIASPHP